MLKHLSFISGLIVFGMGAITPMFKPEIIKIIISWFPIMEIFSTAETMIIGIGLMVASKGLE